MLNPAFYALCRFVFECLSGVRQQGIQGAVLADGMGLGKQQHDIPIVSVILHAASNLLHASRQLQLACLFNMQTLQHSLPSQALLWLSDKVVTSKSLKSAGQAEHACMHRHQLCLAFRMQVRPSRPLPASTVLSPRASLASQPARSPSSCAQHPWCRSADTLRLLLL